MGVCTVQLQPSGLEDLIRQIVRDELRMQGSGNHPGHPGHASPEARDEPYLTVQEAARLARVSACTIRKWISKQRLGARGAGRDTRVLHAEVVNLIEHGRQTSRKETPSLQTIEQRAIEQAKREHRRSQQRRTSLTSMPDPVDL